MDVAATIGHAPDIDAESVRPLPGRRVAIEPVEGRRGPFDLGPCLPLPARDGPRARARVARVRIIAGARPWPDGQGKALPTPVAERRILQSA